MKESYIYTSGSASRSDSGWYIALTLKLDTSSCFKSQTTIQKYLWPQGAVRRGGGRGALRGARAAALAVAHQHAEPARGLGRPHGRRRAVAALGARGAQQLLAGLAHGADQQRGDSLHGQHQRAQLHDAVHRGAGPRRGRPALLVLPDPQRDPAAHDHDDVPRNPASAGHRDLEKQ